jgi:hypothetical protein
LPRYTPHGRSFILFNIETNTIVESYNVTFNETAPCPHDVFECASDKEMEESIIVDKELQGFNGDEDEPLHPSTSSPLPQQLLRHHRLRGRSSPSRVLPLTFRRRIHHNK